MPSAAGRSASRAAPLSRAERLARVAHQRGLRAGSAWRPAVAARYMRSGLQALGWTQQRDQPDATGVAPPHRALAARLLMSLAHYEAEQGRTEYGLRLLDHAEPLAAPADRGVLLSQRGLLLMRMRRDGEAKRLLDEAIILLPGYPDPSYLARALLAAGLAHDAARELDTAIVSFRRQRLDQDHAEAELARSQAALAAGDLQA